ncbi:MAG: LLM class F420-dependent oxidoreductase [Microthrixaceae bacterium]|nr:LLM class F420-dependent oxidoreductase [Microthrixaceae bacterium]MCB1011387.1 LLM class F420-dependent oxidoreductase [Microthrixaceae bacterium]MCO5321462.1 LLM class F420-dependent oxidoreductase [Microthrixaceae bacterium]
MELRIFTEPQQGARYADLLAVALRAERLGFTAFFRSDHYQRMGEGSPGAGPSDAWVTLAGLARDTSTIRLGTMVTAATFRLPGPLAIAVAGVDDMSSGRVELGIGAGWFDDEHTSYGIPFPGLGERFDRLEEQLEVITGLWATPIGETYDHEGRFYRLEDSPALPKPAQSPRPPIILGGFGAKRTPELVARFGDEYNVPFADVETTVALGRNVDAACARLGRDPATVVRSAAQVVCVADDPAELRRRAQGIGRSYDDDLALNGIAGSIEQAREKVGAFEEAGIERLYLQVLDLTDLDHLDELARLGA